MDANPSLKSPGYLLRFLMRTYNIVLLLGLGSTYYRRFERYAAEAEKQMSEPPYKTLIAEEQRSKPSDETRMPEWRSQQQKEWNRLSVMLVLLATASSSLLAVDEAPKLAYSLWLSSSGLSICGLFALQYFSVKSLSMDHDAMTKLLKGKHVVNTKFLAGAVASPVVMALWASVMFVIGVIDYAKQVSKLGGVVYSAFVLVPVGCAVVCIAIIVFVGERIDYLNRQAMKSRSPDPEKGNGKSSLVNTASTLVQEDSPGPQNEQARSPSRACSAHSGSTTSTDETPADMHSTEA